MAAEEITLPLAEEVATISKRRVEIGRVRVTVATGTETRLLRETLHGRRAEVERVPIGRPVAEAPAVREEDGVIIIPVVAEELVVERRLVLREEIRIRLLDTEEAVERPVELRVQHAEVERLPPDGDQDAEQQQPSVKHEEPSG
jgi:stress response protein YsnF